MVFSSTALVGRFRSGSKLSSAYSLKNSDAYLSAGTALGSHYGASRSARFPAGALRQQCYRVNQRYQVEGCITQCTQVILGVSGLGASGSSTIKDRLFVPADTPVHLSAGEIFRSSQVWRAEITPSYLNDGDVMIIGITMFSFSPGNKLVLAAATEMQIRIYTQNCSPYQAYAP